VEIVVKNGFLLTVETSVISNCDNSMWDYIRVDGRISTALISKL